MRSDNAQTSGRGLQLPFFLVGPGIVAGLIPWLLTGWRVREPVPYWAPMRVLGMVLLLAGLSALIQSFARFVVEGFGTPVPVAAPERLVVGGLYRYVRNLMYVAIIAGQALLLDQPGLLLYLAAFWPVVAAFVRCTRNLPSCDGLGPIMNPTGVRCLPGCPVCAPGNPANTTNRAHGDIPGDDFGSARLMARAIVTHAP